MEIKLQRVHYMPKELEQGVLYVSEEFHTSAHLCACGCGAKIRTPLGPTEWSFKETAYGPTLSPSIGNWQQPCRSHYLIRDGKIIWAGQWTTEQITKGRATDELRRQVYYDQLSHAGKHTFMKRLFKWLKNLSANKK